ncbi:MAG: REP-associated tyrosine transposase [Phycisphaerae bacterium]
MNIRRALISVWDKTGIVEFARALHAEFGVEIISTGGTASTLRDAGIPVTLVETLTGCGEMLDGRVKTLHPAIHAAILADRDNPEHMRQLEAAGIKPIDMVVVNLYPFEKTVADPSCTFEQAIEMIDIGGVALLRAAAKNHRHVFVLRTASERTGVLSYLRHRARGWNEDSVSQWRGENAWLTLWSVSRYDACIAEWLARAPQLGRYTMNLRSVFLEELAALRYGENSHQLAALQDLDAVGSPLGYRAPTSENPPMSYNNYLDADAALGLCAEIGRASDKLIAGLSAGSMCYGLPARSDGPRASSPRTEVRGEKHRRRYLPHIEVVGRSYFVTFNTLNFTLAEPARDAVLSACRFWHDKKMRLHIACVMPDHVHLLLTTSKIDEHTAVSLETLMHSIKSFSAKEVNRVMGRSGPVWKQEYWDRIMRDEREFAETWDYIETNASRAGLGDAYAWTWSSTFGFEEGDWVRGEDSGGDGLEARRPKNGLEAHSTARPSGGLEAHSTAPVPDGQEPHSRQEYPGSLVTAVFIKHTNPCGVGISAEPIDAYRRAYLGDPNAAMGGILAVNFPVDAAFAATVMETYDRFGKPLKEAGASYAPGGFFVEVWIAPSFSDDAVEVIRGTAKTTEGIPDPPKKKWGANVRLLAVGDMTVPPDASELQYRSIAGGMLVQSPNVLGLNEEQWKVVTERQPTEAEMADLRLAWLICKHTKSNAITLVQDGKLLGNGAGQMSRVMSCRIATWLARENGHLKEGNREQGTGNSANAQAPVAASDAFFPFSDGPKYLIDAGVTAIIQPGGSKRDEDTIALCNERGVAMIMTGTRHFRH